LRFFPSAARRPLALACLGVVSVVTLAVPLARADDDDDLRARQREVRARIADAEDDLHEASRRVVRAEVRLDYTLERLTDAREELAAVRERLAAARERDAEVAAELADAERALEAATAEAERAADEVVDQRDVVRSTALSIYTDGDPRLRALGSLTTADSLRDVEERIVGQEIVSNRQSDIFVELEDVEAELVAVQADVQRKTDAVEVKKKEAAEQVVAVRALVTEAAAATERVRGIVAEAREARQAAYAARARDRRILRQLEVREKQIADRLAALAKAQEGQTGFRGESDGYLDMPTDGPVTSPFGYRTHPIYGYYSLHNGTDFGVACGTPLRAVAGGTVIDEYYDPAYGNRLFLSLGQVNGKSLVVIYNHLSAFRASEGDRLERGTVLALSGTTGWSTGCHLHFTVMENGVAVDPMKYL
jgi:murein DD-endopeptidase MepM/ murein hydrolase activator NlpD